MTDKRLQRLVINLIDNIDGVTEYALFEKPKTYKDIKIEYIDGRIFVSYNGKVSYFFTHGKYFNNLDLLERVMFCFNIKLEGKEPQDIRTFKKQIVEKLKENKNG